MFRKCGLAAITVIFVSISAASSAAPVLDARVSPDQLLNEIERIVRHEFYDPAGLGAFNSAEENVRADVASGADISDASNDWLAALDTSHTGRFTPDTIEYFELADVFSRAIRDDVRRLFPPEGNVTYEGIGIATEEIDDKRFIADVYDGSPAAAAGLKVGDEIVAVDGMPFQSIGSFAGKAGRSAKVEVRRAPEGPIITFGVTVRSLQPAETFNEAIRKSVRIVDRDGKRLGYMRIWSFASRGAEEVLGELLTSEPLKSADGLVLDLRGRWGGAPPDAVDYFVGKSPTMTVTDRDGETEIVSTSWGKPVVAIIDEGSRSGIEILAYAWKRAGVPLVGARRAGDVVAGRAFVLKDNSLLELAVTDVHVDGKRLEGNGVTPDIGVPFELRYSAGIDPQMERAVEKMREMLRDQRDPLSEDG